MSGMEERDNALEQHDLKDSDWRRQRRSGAMIIAASAVVAAVLWLAIRWLGPAIPQMDTVADRLIFAFKCWCFAVLFCFATGIDAVAHERLQSPAFDPLAGYETKRLRVNLRYLQNTLEQLIVFTPGLFGLALYSEGGDGMRAVEATAVVWILFRFAFLDWLPSQRHHAQLRGSGRRVKPDSSDLRGCAHQLRSRGHDRSSNCSQRLFGHRGGSLLDDPLPQRARP
jgi:hypothetical protein